MTKREIHLPEFLYHYTSLESLEAILKYKTIRFSKLSTVNDPEDGLTEDLLSSQKLVYCSSWTIDEDSLHMWNMYATMKGVRIKLPVDIFLTIEGRKFGKRNFCEETHFVSDLQTPFKVELQNKTHKEIHEIKKLFGPDKVIYFKEKKLPKAVGEAITMSSFKTFDTANMFEDFIQFGGTGLYKYKCWAIENEYRYRLTLDTLNVKGKKTKETYMEMELVNDYHDLSLNEKAFDDLEIMLGPTADDETLEAVKNLCEEYLPGKDVTFTKSKILYRE